MQTYLEPTQDAGRALLKRGISGEIIMLNLLRLREVAMTTPPTPGSRLSNRSLAPKPMTVTLPIHFLI